MSITINPSTELLTEEQKEMLYFIYQGKKAARDIFITFADIYKDENRFTLIQFSRQRHMDCAKELCEIYGVSTTQIDEARIGELESPVLQTVYDVCIEKGKRSIDDALEVAAFIQDAEIQGLEHASIGMPEHVVSVYEKLKQRDLRQLGTFQAALSDAA
ncbi:MAG TPA: DUF2202 domain-containing protein [Sulfurovum sp.]|uniref:DUF2202 domain-containing protein n=1 Tax=Sulfurovum sp. TaxID=1969726 RepID=UPI002F93FA66